jgi:organic radical activating enzyme
MNMLPVSEVYGPVWQGEGPDTGRRCSFLRLGHCNLACDWCDTPYTWDDDRYDVDAECPPTSNDKIMAELERHGTDTVVLTGGEPLLHARRPAMLDLLDRLSLRAWSIHVETNGTIPPPDWIDRCETVAVSPKVNTSDQEARRIRMNTLRDWAKTPNAVLKVVCNRPEDLTVVDQIVQTTRWDLHRVWIMPEGTTPDTVLTHARALEPAVAARAYNLTLRQHVLIHGDRRLT